MTVSRCDFYPQSSTGILGSYLPQSKAGRLLILFPFTAVSSASDSSSPWMCTRMAVLRSQVAFALAVFVLTFLAFCQAEEVLPMFIHRATCGQSGNLLEQARSNVAAMGHYGDLAIGHYLRNRKNPPSEGTDPQSIEWKRIKFPLEAVLGFEISDEQLKQVQGMGDESHPTPWGICDSRIYRFS